MKETIQRDTPVDLFNNILKTARNAGALQELDRIIDYDSACEFMEENRKPISHYEFSTVFSVDFGGSEGIYIDAWLHGHLDESGHTKRLRFGTIKTLESSLNALKIMGDACGILQFYARYSAFMPGLPAHGTHYRAEASVFLERADETICRPLRTLRS